jgi:hypothetical protein
MRFIVRYTLSVVFFILLFGQAAGAADGTSIFFRDRDRPRFQDLYTHHPMFADLRHQMDTVDRVRERAFLRGGVRFNDHLYDIERIGTLAQRMALVYLYTGDADAADLAVECINTIMKFPKWDYFLEGGTDVVGLQRAPNSALAVALVIEALGSRIDGAKRDAWLRIMAVRGTEPCFRATYGMRYPDRVKGWTMDTTSTYFEHRPLERTISLAKWPVILNTINLKAIPASVLTLSALVYRKYLGETDDTRRWIEQGIYSVGTFRDIYAPDGSYNEGVSYAHYTTLHLIQAIEALRLTGQADVTDLLNWQGYQDYMLEMTLPTRDDPKAMVNFGDASTGGQASVSFWIARQTRDAEAQWFGETMALARDPWSVIYLDSTVHAVPPAAGVHLWRSDLSWLVGRTGYGPDDLVVAMRSGPPYNHEHADRNGMILKCYGERLVVDPMRPPYAQRDPSWIMRLTPGHSAALVDGKGHQYVSGADGTNASEAVAKLIRHGERNGYMFWTSDATPAFQLVLPDVASITRTMITLPDVPAVVVIDKLIKKTTPSTLQARYYAYNSDGKGVVESGEDGFSIKRPYAFLQGQSISGGGVAVHSALPAIPKEKAVLYPFIETSIARPLMESCLVTVLEPVRGTERHARATVSCRDGVYTVFFPNEGKHIVLRVMDTGAVPEFEVR